MNRMDRAVESLSGFLVGRRNLLAALFAGITLLLAHSATNVKLDPGFLKQIPIKHPYMQTMMEYAHEFSGANMLLVNLRWKGEGDIYNADFMNALLKANDDVFFIPGIDRTKVSSIYSPGTYYIEITEYGFDGKPVVPARFAGKPEELEEVRKNVALSGQIGLLVANDLKAALIRANLQEADTGDPAKAEMFYRQVMTKLGDIRGRFESPHKYVYTLRDDLPPFKAGDTVAEGYVDYGWMRPFQTFFVQSELSPDPIAVDGSALSVEAVDNPDFNPNIEVNIIGFAQLLSDVINGLIDVFAFFALAFAITAALLYAYTRSLRVTIAALGVALLPVVWLVGVLPLIGYGIDPMSILVPFLIFAIGVSHAVQMTNVWRAEVMAGADSRTAARTSFNKLFVPGAIALLTDGMGFAVIMLIDIPIVHELGITTCIGVLLMIVTNKFVLPIILSHVTLEQTSCQRAVREQSPLAQAVVGAFAKCAEPRCAVYCFAVCLAILGTTAWLSRGLVIGDSGTGVPELHPDARYNVDSRAIADSYNIGVDVLTVIAEAKPFEGDSCLHYEVINLLDRFEMFARGIDGVRSVVGVGGVGKLVIAAFNEGNPRWRALPRSSAGLSTGSRAFDPNLGLNTENCRAIQTIVFMKDHDGTTVAHAIKEIKRFIADNPVPGVTLRLASGNVGVMAATNEAVAAAEVKMLLAIYGAVILFCLLTFRSGYATACIIVPLVMVSVFGNAVMAVLDIGLKVATLPVIALGVGIGIDYGLYLFERIQHHMNVEGRDFRAAFERAMWERGSAVVFTAITMSVGVATWMLSALKFQADMGLLLAFMFVANMLGAVCLLPALGAWFYRRDSLVRSGAAVAPAK